MSLVSTSQAVVSFHNLKPWPLRPCNSPFFAASRPISPRLDFPHSSLLHFSFIELDQKLINLPHALRSLPCQPFFNPILLLCFSWFCNFKRLSLLYIPHISLSSSSLSRHYTALHNEDYNLCHAFLCCCVSRQRWHRRYACLLRSNRWEAVRRLSLWCSYASGLRVSCYSSDFPSWYWLSQ